MFAATVGVTGASGFIGRSVCTQLLERGHRVRAIDKSPFPRSMRTSHRVEACEVDLRNRLDAKEALAGLDYCIALAARSSGVGYFSSHQAEMLDDNCVITANTFAAANENQLKRIVYASSSCVYQDVMSGDARESDLDDSAMPPPGYPFSKLVGEYFCRAFASQFNLEYVVIRPFNVYGPGEPPSPTPGDSHVIPDLTCKILSGAYPLAIFGDGSQTRCFTYVDDIARGIVLALESSNARNQVFNLGHPNEISILELSKALWTLCQRSERFATRSLHPFENDVRRRAVDATKASAMLGWTPEVTLLDGLKNYIDWYVENVEGHPTEEICQAGA